MNKTNFVGKNLENVTRHAAWLVD